jgi:hypothetical protein
MLAALQQAQAVIANQGLQVVTNLDGATCSDAGHVLRGLFPSTPAVGQRTLLFLLIYAQVSTLDTFPAVRVVLPQRCPGPWQSPPSRLISLPILSPRPAALSSAAVVCTSRSAPW